MNTRERVHKAVDERRFDDLVALAVEDSRALRHLLALAYREEPEIRAAAVRGIALASRHHPRLVQETARRLVWAMNDESGTHAATAPEVLRAIADEAPDLLLPLVSDLLRLTADPSLHDALVEVVRLVAAHDHGRTLATLTENLNTCIRGDAS
jgi:hypothetical protein